MYIVDVFKRIDPLELLNCPMGLINYYYFQAWRRNEAMEEERKKEEKRKAVEEKKKGKSGYNARIHPAQGGKPFSLTSDMIDELQEEFE